MVSGRAASSDSDPGNGGVIPGAGGAAAFRLWSREASGLPLLIAVPHAGRIYTPAVLERMNNPGHAALRLEDRHVDDVAIEVARQTGAALLIADAPRAMIDLNRAPDDVDWDMFGQAPRESGLANRRARSGLGLIPRRISGLGELWKAQHGQDELTERIAAIHTPYHAAIADTLDRIRARWGAALLVDLHSMPPLPQRAGQPSAALVLGDRFGASCHGWIVAGAFAHLAESKTQVAHNRPYAGGYVLEQHGDPANGIHALQIEIDRRLYLDSAMDRLGPGFAATARLVAGLIVRLAGETAKLNKWAEAAE